MDFVGNLILMWLASGLQKTTAPTQPLRAPAWPTPSSPPPIPAFQPAKPADASQPATPLATLHHEALAPPKPKPAAKPKPKPAPRAAAPKPAPAAPKPAPESAIRSALRAATPSPKSFFSAALKRVKPSATVKLVPGQLTSTIPVARVQSVLNARGAKLKPDGLYGPKTAAAWANIAASKGLPYTIKRKGPKTAEVVTQTLDALSVPSIP